ncbi:hypothetical protein HLPR_15990 [Helicovermis profundi]|uniref:Reverse transcriptase domain-containing protein n=1 Tax=Helicovermis profundi TaxID=3065157 RepID=A0AAU9EI93_9FIRM|nr:hypothetical protein HLPR_15990 [Clostridia bacterium S502]
MLTIQIAGAIVDRKFEETSIGLAQGGNLSPLCSNIMLNELDKELERRGIRFVRYADDALLFVLIVKLFDVGFFKLNYVKNS